MSDTTSPTAPAWHAYAFLTITSMCWGLNAVLGRAAVGEVSPMTLVILRWLGVAILVLIFTHKDLISAWPTLKKHLLFIGAMSIVGFTAFNTLFYIAAHSTTAVNIGILQGSIPVFVLLGAFVAYRTRVTPMQVIGVPVTIAGVVIVAVGGDLERLKALAFNHGDLLMLLACFFYASYTVGLQRRPKVPVMAMFGMLAFGALIASVPGLLYEISTATFVAPTGKGWMLIGLVALFPSFLAQITFMKGVEAIGPGRAGIFVNLVPIFAAMMAVIFLGEVFKTYHAIALVLVLGGIWIAERGKKG